LYTRFIHREETMTTGNQGRGRPSGSTIPAERRRQRKDYRFAPPILHQIEQGRALLAHASEQHKAPKETAFIEMAIQHYVAFLAGSPQEVIANQETGRLQAQVRNLEHELRATRISLRLAEERIATLLTPPAKPKYVDLSKAYQIYITHAGNEHPQLPDGLQYAPEDPPEIGYYHCPTHEVFQQICPIARVRRELERLKSVPGLTKIWISKNGRRLERIAGVPTDSWTWENGRWDKD
jgi:hypothetical protein